MWAEIMYPYVAQDQVFQSPSPCCGFMCLPAELLRGNITRWKTIGIPELLPEGNYPPTRDLHISFVEQNANLHRVKLGHLAMF